MTLNQAQYLTMRLVCECLALSPSYLYDLIARGCFPRFVQFGPRFRALPEEELWQWIGILLMLRDLMSSLHAEVELPLWSAQELESVPVPPERIVLLRKPDVLTQLRFGESHLNRLMHLDDPELRFPWPVPVGVRARRWVAQEVADWLARRRADRARNLAESRGWICKRPRSDSESGRDEPRPPTE